MASAGKFVAMAARSLRAPGSSAWRNLPKPSGAKPGSLAGLQMSRLLAAQAKRQYDYPKSEEEVVDLDSGSKPEGDGDSESIPDLPDQKLTNKLIKEQMIQTKLMAEQGAAKSAEVQQHVKSSDAELSYLGISMAPFSEEIRNILMGPLGSEDVEIKPDGVIYLPEIRYRRILQQAFGPGGWALMPRNEPSHYQSDTEAAQLITREYALFCLGRFVSQSVGEHSFYSKSNLSIGKALESAKSNALMRCCKDLGIASELWDPRYVSSWKSENATELWCENVRTKDKKKLWKKKTAKEMFPYPWKETKA